MTVVGVVFVGTGAPRMHGVHHFGQLHSFQPPNGPSQKGTGQHLLMGSPWLLLFLDGS